MWGGSGLLQRRPGGFEPGMLRFARYASRPDGPSDTRVPLGDSKRRPQWPDTTRDIKRHSYLGVKRYSRMSFYLARRTVCGARVGRQMCRVGRQMLELLWSEFLGFFVDFFFFSNCRCFSPGHKVSLDFTITRVWKRHKSCATASTVTRSPRPDPAEHLREFFEAAFPTPPLKKKKKRLTEEISAGRKHRSSLQDGSKDSERPCQRALKRFWKLVMAWRPRTALDAVYTCMWL